MNKRRKDQLNNGIRGYRGLDKLFAWVSQTVDQDSVLTEDGRWQAPPSQRQRAAEEDVFWGKGDDVAQGRKITAFVAGLAVFAAGFTYGLENQAPEEPPAAVQTHVAK